MKNVRINIAYIHTEELNSIHCYFIEDKTNNVILLYKNIISNINFAELKASDCSMIALKITDAAKKQQFKIVGKLNCYVYSKEIFSLINVFPNISKSKIEKFIKRDMQDSFPDYEKKLVYNENIHSDGKNEYIHNIHLCPNSYLEVFDSIAKCMHLPLGSVSSPDLIIDSLYESKLKKENKELIFINIEESITTINLFINGLDTDSITLPYGYNSNNPSYKDEIKKLILAITAKHEFTTENTFVQKVLINTQNTSFISEVEDALNGLGLFEIIHNEKPYDLHTFIPSSKHSFKKYKKSFLGKGFTLVEVVVSLAIFSLISALAITAITVSSGLPRKSEKIVKANNLISNIGEIYRADSSKHFFENYYLINNADFTPSYSSNITKTDESYSYIFYFDNNFELIPSTYNNESMGSYNFSYMLNCTNTIKTSESDQHKLTITQFCSIDNQENLIKDNNIIEFRGL